MAKSVPLHYIIAERTVELIAEGSHRKSTQERVSNGKIQTVEVNQYSFQHNGEIFISSADIYDDLSLAAIKLVIRIQRDLKMNNPLWECEDKDKRDIRAALAQLKRKDIIYTIPGTDIYIVNPLKLRKGRPLAVYGALYTYCKKKWLVDKTWRPTNADIKRFTAPKEVTLPQCTSDYTTEIDFGNH